MLGSAVVLAALSGIGVLASVFSGHKQFLDEVNKTRAQYGVPALCLSEYSHAHGLAVS